MVRVTVCDVLEMLRFAHHHLWLVGTAVEGNDVADCLTGAEDWHQDVYGVVRSGGAMEICAEEQLVSGKHLGPLLQPP